MSVMRDIQHVNSGPLGKPRQPCYAIIIGYPAGLTATRTLAQMLGVDYRGATMGRQLMRSHCGIVLQVWPTCTLLFDVRSQSTILWLVTGCQVLAHMPPWSHSIQLHGMGLMSDREAISVYVGQQLSVNWKCSKDVISYSLSFFYCLCRC